jgi:hypothetical protein
MINEIVKPIGEAIADLEFVARYGGIVNVVSRLDQIGETDEGVPIVREQRYPVACGVTSLECWENGRYQDLIPNDNFASIVYFEQMDGMRFEKIEEGNARQIFYTFSERLRLVAWMNLAKLGIEDCNGGSAISLALIKQLTRTYKDLSEPFDISRLVITPVAIEPKHQNPFSKYTYNELDAMWMYPYDYLSIIVEFKITVNKNCLPDFTPGESVACPIDTFSPVVPPVPSSDFGYQFYEQRWPRMKRFGRTMYFMSFDLGTGTGDYKTLEGLLIADVREIVHSEFGSRKIDSNNWQTITAYPEDTGGAEYGFLTSDQDERIIVTLWYTKN